jgi:hypothetical protein
VFGYRLQVFELAGRNPVADACRNLRHSPLDTLRLEGSD